MNNLIAPKCSRSCRCPPPPALSSRAETARDHAIAIVLAGDPLGLESGRDLLRKVQHAYPELLDGCAERRARLSASTLILCCRFRRVITF
jgi:hypothetical protein